MGRGEGQHTPWVPEVLSLLNVLIEALSRPSLCSQPLNDQLLFLGNTGLRWGRRETAGVGPERPPPLSLLWQCLLYLHA